MPRTKQFRPFAEARRIARDLKLSSVMEWRRYCKAGKRPADIPVRPDVSYATEWRGWPDWLGNDCPDIGD